MVISQQQTNKTMQPKTYKVLTEAVSSGIEYGWRRAHKHTDTPDERELKNEINNAIMLEISEYFTFTPDEFYQEETYQP